MQLITLNIWGGHVKKPLLNFIDANKSVDIVCLQEVYHQADKKVSTDDREVSLDIFSEISTLLSEHQGFFCPTVNHYYGLAIFIKKNITVLNEGEIFIHENPHYIGLGPTHSRKLQWLECQSNGKEFVIMNVHGLWNGNGKTDSPPRIEQSMRIKKFLDTFTVPKILCGDFNLRPNTDSIKILEEGMQNLIRDHHITSTRTSLYPKEEKFADYTFASRDINVRSFRVLSDEVSDHCPLFLDFI